MTRGTAQLSCEVHVAGTRLADTAAQWHGSAPTVLADLRVTWGRRSVADQPDPATCTFTVADRDADTDFLRLLGVGRTVDVYAAGELIGEGEAGDIAVDGEFDTRPTTDRAVATAAALMRPALTVEALTAGAAVAIPIAPWGDQATSWDDLPRVRPGEAWAVALEVTTGHAVTANMTAALFTDPRRRLLPPAIGPTQTVPVDTTTTVTVNLAASDAAIGWLGARVGFTLTPWTNETSSWADAAGSWRDWRTAQLHHLEVVAPARAQRTVLVFSGRITDLEAGAAVRGIEVQAAALDVLADLANDVIGDEPWPVQTIGTRVERIRELARTPFDVELDPRPAALNVSYRDVDAQPVYGLLTELADSADAVLWPAAHITRGAYLWLEDTDERAALGILRWDSIVELVVIEGTGGPDRAVGLSACDIDAETVRFRSDVADVLTRVDLTWLEQTLDEDGKLAPTERHVLVVDEPAEDPARGNLGVRRAGYTTQLVDEDDGRDVATRVLARSRSTGWHATGVVWDTVLPEVFGDRHRDAALDLLDGTRRIGLPVVVSDLPGWVPSGAGQLVANIEGGTWSYTGGRWIFDATISPNGSTGYSATWNDLDPAWSWNEFDPAITWWRCWGVTAEYASLRWSQLDDHPWLEDPNIWTDYYGPAHQNGEDDHA